ncbi:imidazole glycerol phosphate synthase subunit HisH [Pantoea sp. Aalb]|uniref:imidazole glycerol phosphate synthase subunit HisH n=1 Tax=Pantoea sp. Aalb TaxID=2576762 RepID=UPI001325C319|nr:imidazole glycerol phosphate synthase subunit HisH [Pantoea sp. Aalb]MXP67335.1 imidazole glycerol phosphate synthase subunit HisH [Pantoea sp. Aalb]
MKVVILDTGCANLLSLKWAIKRLGYTLEISNEPSMLMKADKILLPGVGSAKAAMNQLKSFNLIDLIKKLHQPILGICLGMQIFGCRSSENGGINTLGIIDKPVSIINTKGLPLPHIGWNKIIVETKHFLFNNIPNNSYFYFIHSYAMSLNYHTIAKCNYGFVFTAALQKNNFFGVQFHPERSGTVGAQLLKNFLEI